jgi:hypothetical protein
MLANSQNFIFQKINGYYPSQDDALALTHHHKALRQTHEMMKDPLKHKSDETLGAVVSFMCHHVGQQLQEACTLLTRSRHCLVIS